MARSLSASLAAVPARIILPPRAVMDGGIGTALIARGLDVGREPAEAWNLTQPAKVRDVHRRFVAAGCQLIQTNTFGGNRMRLRAFGREHEVAATNHAAVELARAEADGSIVVGSLGPTGLTPPPEGDANLHELEDAFAEQAALLVGAGVVFLHLETFHRPKELRAALRGARAGAPGTPVVASFTCLLPSPGSDRGNESALRTPSGYSVDHLVNVLVEEAADGVGVNCGLAPLEMLPLIRLLVARIDGPVFAKPLAASARRAPLSPGEFAASSIELFAAGAACVGGCCGTGPADLAALRAALG